MTNQPTARQLQTHRAGAAISQLLRRRSVDNTAYIIAPIISAREGVMNGVLYLAEELERSAPAWDGQPAPLGHPTDSAGNFVSAHSAGAPPAAATIRASRWSAKTTSLKHEVWIDVAAATALGGEWLTLLARLERGDVIDVSTGLYAEMEPATGARNGEPFTAIARNIQPDHIAILLNEVGACSLRDGCGLPRVNQRQQQEEPMSISINYELALDEQAGVVYRAWYERNGYDAGQVRDVFPDRLIVRTEGVLAQVGYTVSADGVEFDEPVEVDYRPTATPASNAPAGWLNALKNHLSKLFNEEAAMDRDKMIQNLLANQRNALSQETLAGLGDDELAAYADSLKPPCANSQQPAPAPQPAVSTAQFDALVKSVNQLTAQIQANADREKQGIVAQIAANTDAWSEAELLGKELSDLQKIHRIVVPADYSGQGRVAVNAAAGEWEDYAIEEVN